MNKKIEKMNEKIMVSYCMGCGKIRLPDGSWGVPELSLDSYVLSHSYCKPCEEQAIAEAMSQIEKAKKKIAWSKPVLLEIGKRGGAELGYHEIVKLSDKFEYGIGGRK